MYFFMIIGIFFIFIWPIIKIIASFFNKPSKNYSPSNPKINMLIDFATLMTKHIQNNLEINSPLVFYEQVYLLYFLQDMYSVGKNISQKYRDTMLNDLILTLSYNHKLDYLNKKDDFKKIFIKRYQNYLYLLDTDKYNFSETFFEYIIQYQCLLIATIESKNIFSNISAKSLEGTDYEWGVEGGSVYLTKNRHKEIEFILKDNLVLINSYFSQI